MAKPRRQPGYQREYQTDKWLDEALGSYVPDEIAQAKTDPKRMSPARQGVNAFVRSAVPGAAYFADDLKSLPGVGGLVEEPPPPVLPEEIVSQGAGNIFGTIVPGVGYYTGLQKLMRLGNPARKSVNLAQTVSPTAGLSERIGREAIRGAGTGQALGLFHTKNPSEMVGGGTAAGVIGGSVHLP